jgi:HAD superfamily hydrolase (TIGR01549 family)
MTPSSIRAVIFDMDGTITKPYLDFRAIRAAIGISEPLLENMMALPPGPARDRAFALLEQFEEEAAEASKLNDGARQVLEALSGRGVPSALLTRNSRRSTERVLVKHSLSFQAVVTREDAPVKPRPEPLWLICDKLGVRPSQVLMVGDFTFDILAGRNAGTRTAFLTNGRETVHAADAVPDHVLDRLTDLLAVL